MLLTLKDAVVVQQFFKYILHHILSIGCAAAIMHRSAVDGVAVTLHRQGKYFVSGQLSHCINSPWMPGSGLLDGMFVVLTGTFT